MKNLRRFLGFALHYESAESVENWDDFVLLLGKGLDYFLSELKLISNLKTKQKIGSWQLVTWRKNWRRLPCSCCIAPQVLKINYLTYFSSTFKIQERKMKNFQILKISAKSTKSWENFALLANERLVCHFSELKTDFAVCEIS